MRAIVLATCAALALAGCGGEPDQPKSDEEVMQAADRLVKPRPGLYRTSAELIEFEIPGIPPAQAAQMRDMAAGLQGRDRTQCLTQADADEGFERVVRRFGEGQQGVTCAFTRFDAAGSDLDALLACTGQDGVQAEMTIDGTLEEERSEMRMAIVQQAAAIPGGEMRMTMEVTSERVGDCP